MSNYAQGYHYVYINFGGCKKTNKMKWLAERNILQNIINC